MATVDEYFADAVGRHQAGDLDAAERLYRQVLSAAPSHPGSLSNLGVILARRGALDEAAKCYNAALAVNPNQLDAHFNLGNLYRRLKRPQDAVPAYEAALQIEPRHPRVLLNLGLAVSDLGDWAAAIELYRQATAVDPGFAEAYNLLGDALFRTGKADESVAVFREFVVRVPDDPRGHHNLGLALAARGDHAEAVPELEQALGLRPDYPEAHNSLGVTLESVGRSDEAVGHYRRAVELRPNFPDAWSNLGTSLTERARTEEATAALLKSLDLRPDPRVHSNLLLAMSYSSDYTPEKLRDEHAVWATIHAKTPPAVPARHVGGSPDRRLKVGYVSADFRTHSTAGFAELLLTHHDRNRVHVTCYPNVARPDAVTDKLRRLADSWRPISGVADGRAAEMIRDDEIDILVDLNGHMAGNRLSLFARKPAPVQVTLFGYPSTTGIAAMDYRISDPFADPPGEAGEYYVEKVLRLPEVAWVYKPPADAPDPGPLPVLKAQTFTFGCLNNPAKLSDACVETWARVLKAVKRSKLVLMGGRSVEGGQAFHERFSRFGVASDRVEVMGRVPPGRSYFEAYQPFDVALDPFPYNGGVTSCDALWMGVPVLTAAGRDYRSRQGVSLMNNLGLPEFVADSPDKLVDLAATWREERDGLADVRGSLRELMGASAITDAGRYVKHLEDAFRTAWREAATPSNA